MFYRYTDEKWRSGGELELFGAKQLKTHFGVLALGRRNTSLICKYYGNLVSRCWEVEVVALVIRFLRNLACFEL